MLVSSQVLLRSRILRENGKYIPRQVGHGTALWGDYRVNLCVFKLCVCVCVDFLSSPVFRHEETLLQQCRDWLLQEGQKEGRPQKPNDRCVCIKSVDELSQQVVFPKVHLRELKSNFVCVLMQIPAC